MVLFGSLLDQFVGCFGHANVLSSFHFVVDWLIDFSTRILPVINGFNGLETFIVSLITKNPISRFMLEMEMIFMSILSFETRCSNSAASLVQWWVPTILLFFRCFVWRSGLLEYWMRSYFRGQWLGCSLRLGTPLNSTWTHPGSWLYLPFRGQWSCRLRSNNGNCTWTNDWQFSAFPRSRIPAFITDGILANLCDLTQSCRHRDKILQ